MVWLGCVCTHRWGYKQLEERLVWSQNSEIYRIHLKKHYYCTIDHIHKLYITHKSTLFNNKKKEGRKYNFKFDACKLLELKKCHKSAKTNKKKLNWN